MSKAFTTLKEKFRAAKARAVSSYEDVCERIAAGGDVDEETVERILQDSGQSFDELDAEVDRRTKRNERKSHLVSIARHVQEREAAHLPKHNGLDAELRAIREKARQEELSLARECSSLYEAVKESSNAVEQLWSDFSPDDVREQHDALADTTEQRKLRQTWFLQEAK